MPKSASKRLKEASQRFCKQDPALYNKVVYACVLRATLMKKYVSYSY